MTWQLPPTWPIPREWRGERAFIICTGESVGAQAPLIKRLRGRIIVVKHAVNLRPDADVLFLSGERAPDRVALSLLPKFKGRYVIVRQKFDPSFPDYVKRVTRTKHHDRLCDLPDHVAGLDSGTSAINVAHLFGATEIVLLGFDMVGGHYCKHPLQFPPDDHFQRHMEVLPAIAADAKARGIRIVNCSPISRVKCFERAPLEDFV